MNRMLFNGLHYTKNGAGISRYTGELINEFRRQGYPIDVMMRKEWEEEYGGEGIYFIDQDIQGSAKRIIEEQYHQRKRYKQYELVHFPDYASPVLYNGKKIVTIHDMAMHTMREKYTFMQNMTKNVLLKQTIKKADCLICDSHFAKRELLKYYPEVEERTRVVYLGIEGLEYNLDTEAEEAVLAKLGTSRTYILYVGTIAPHKNIEQLIAAFKKIKLLGCTHKLVIAGKRGWMDSAIMEKAKLEGVDEDVIFTGFVTDKELEVLYRRAAFFVSVSLYEGFGFPPLEAMVRGCPVLVSDIEVFRETCEEKAVYCNPLDAEDIAKKMEKLLEDNRLRTKLVVDGKEHVKQFNWGKTARLTYEVYKSVLDGHIK